MIRFAAVIPARYASTRFPGKPLAASTGMPLIRHVWERVRRVSGLSEVIVATDDARIRDACKSFGAKAVMTPADLPSGSDRVALAARSLDVQGILNVQGDEPEIDPGDLERLLACFSDDTIPMATLAYRSVSEDAFRDPNVVKVACAASGDALYFSRAPIPYGPEGHGAEFLKHQGVYAYRAEVLQRLATLEPTVLERRERLEQLRALENGFRIRVVVARHDSAGIDTPEQYEAFVGRHAAQRELAERAGTRSGAWPNTSS